MSVLIYYTADLTTPDNTDENCYGEPCQPGYGYSLESGWLDPDWSIWEVQENREDVSPDEIGPDEIEEAGSLKKAIEEAITSRLGTLDSWDGISAYAADDVQNYKTGERVMMAAHVYTNRGKHRNTDEEVTA